MSSNNHSATILAAQLFAKSGNRTHIEGLTHWAIEDELLKYATDHARDGENLAAAITRLSHDDEIAKALARAAYWAERAMDRLTSGQKLAAFEKHLGVDKVEKAARDPGSRDHIADLMDEIAKRERRPGESMVDAYSRLANTDEVFKRALVAYNSAS